MSLSVFNLNDLIVFLFRKMYKGLVNRITIYIHIYTHTRADQYKAEKVNCDYFHNKHLFLEI